MAKKRSLLQKMEDNPKDDWQIADVERLCREFGLYLEPPRTGSHFTVHSDFLEGAPTVPARKPIKPVYIKQFTRFVRAHLKCMPKPKPEAKRAGKAAGRTK